MPGLYACRRRWDIGSDDFMFPAFAEIWVRLAWLLSISVVIDTHKHSFSCSSGAVVQIYYYGMLTILSSHIIMDVILMILSSRGTITDPGPRRRLPFVLYIKMSLFAPEFMWTILGTYWAFDDASDCSETVVLAVKIAAIAGWIILLCLMVGLFVVFDPLGHHNLRDDASVSAARKLWETRCRVICCCAGCEEQNSDVFSDIARLLSEYFTGVDLVATDVAAGLILVQHAQSKEPQRFQYARIPSAHTRPREARNASQDNGHHVDMVDSRHQVQSSILVEVADNEGMLQTVDNGRTLVTNGQSATNGVVHQPSPTTNANQYGITVISENETAGNPPSCAIAPSTSSDPNCACDLENLDVDIGKQSEKDLLSPQDWMTVRNAAYYMKFALATYSWPVYMYMNILTGACRLWENCRCCSCTTHTENITQDNCCTCHTSAILKITNVQRHDIIYASFYNRIYEIPFMVMLDHTNRSIVIAIRGTMSLKDALTDMCADSENCRVEGLGDQYVHKGILQAAKYIESTLENMNLLERAFQKGPGYRLVVTGHSLGAGAATLLSILLRPKYRDLICFAYSPPGWLLSLPLARYTENFVCSVVVGKDLIPRLGLTTMEKLKVQILQELTTCHKPKFRILAGGCWRMVCGKPDNNENEAARQRLVDESRPKCYTQEQEGLEEAIHQSQRACMTSIKLYMPGIVLYLEEEEPTRGCFETPVYRPVWAKPDNFTDIIVHPKMLTDHLPDAVLKALDDLDERSSQPRYMLRAEPQT